MIFIVNFDLFRWVFFFYVDVELINGIIKYIYVYVKYGYILILMWRNVLGV